MSDLRVLCLHGYHGSGAILRDQMKSLTARLPANIEFAYVDAPSLATGISAGGTRASTAGSAPATGRSS